MTEALFYQRPVPLNRTSHCNLRIKPTPSMAFAAKAHSVPLTGAEFAPAARNLPVLFGGSSVEDAAPIVLLGLRQNENLFVDAEGRWDQETYVPAFVRRYPFILAEKPEGAEGDDFTVFLDEDFAGFSSEEGERLFDDQGQESPLLKHAVTFLSEFQGQVTATQALMKRLRALDLLESRHIQIKHNESDQGLTLNGLWMVNEEKLRSLDAATLHGLVQNGWLGWVYAHLISLGHIERLIARLNQRVAAPSDAAAANA